MKGNRSDRRLASVNRTKRTLLPGFVWNPLLSYPPHKLCWCGKREMAKDCCFFKVAKAVPKEVALVLHQYMNAVRKGESPKIKVVAADKSEVRGYQDLKVAEAIAGKLVDNPKLITDPVAVANIVREATAMHKDILK